MKFIMLRVPKYIPNTGATSDEPVYININQISEIVPNELAQRRGDIDGWKAVVVMNNDNEYRVVEDCDRIIELIRAACTE